MRTQRTKSSFQILKNYPCGKMLRQDRDFSMIDAIKQQFEKQWSRGKNNVIYMGLVPGPNKPDNICGKTKVTGTMQRDSTLYIYICLHSVHRDNFTLYETQLSWCVTSPFHLRRARDRCQQLLPVTGQLTGNNSFCWT